MNINKMITQQALKGFGFSPMCINLNTKMSKDSLVNYASMLPAQGADSGIWSIESTAFTLHLLVEISGPLHLDIVT
jgi:hypothetical protein